MKTRNQNTASRMLLLILTLLSGLNAALADSPPLYLREKPVCPVDSYLEVGKCYRSTPNSQKLREFRESSREKVKQYYDADQSIFLPGTTEAEKNLARSYFYASTMADIPGEIDRFDRDEIQPAPEGKEKETLYQQDEKAIDECNNAIGSTEYTYKIGSILIMHPRLLTTDSIFMIERLYPSRLTDSTSNCAGYLYGSVRGYSLSAFEYGKFEADAEKKAQIESLYEIAYLKNKKAGELRRTPTAVYPKSLVRQHADQSGLTAYILEKQKAAGKRLNHEELAIEFFGSRDKWVKSLNAAINRKMI